MPEREEPFEVCPELERMHRARMLGGQTDAEVAVVEYDLEQVACRPDNCPGPYLGERQVLVTPRFPLAGRLYSAIEHVVAGPTQMQCPMNENATPAVQPESFE